MVVKPKKIAVPCFHNKPALVTRSSIVPSLSELQLNEAKAPTVKLLAVPSHVFTNIDTKDSLSKSDAAIGQLKIT
jgi:hypothetical protein